MAGAGSLASGGWVSFGNNKSAWDSASESLGVTCSAVKIVEIEAAFLCAW